MANSISPASVPDGFNVASGAQQAAPVRQRLPESCTSLKVPQINGFVMRPCVALAPTALKFHAECANADLRRESERL
jgi:hypothetical protein